MSQAKILTSAELRRVLDHVATRPHAERNRAMVLCSHYGGMRVKEIAALRYCDVVNLDGTIKDEIYLSAEQTKGRHSRTVYVSSKLQKELKAYITAVPPRDREQPLFQPQKREPRDSVQIRPVSSSIGSIKVWGSRGPVRTAGEGGG